MPSEHPNVARIAARCGIGCVFLAEVVLMAIIFWYIRVRLSIPFHFISKENIRYVAISLLFIPVTLGIRALGFGYIWTSILSVLVCMALYFGALLLLKDETMWFLTRKVLGKLKRS